MTAAEPGLAQTLDAALERIGSAMDMHELEMAWCEGLRCHRNRRDRDRILAEAGTRLHTFGGAKGELLRRNWLCQVADEVSLMDGQPLDEALEAVAAAETREAFALVAEDLAALRSATERDQGVHDYVERSPLPAMRIRDLGRTAGRLRGSGVLALVTNNDVELAIGLAQALVPQRPPVVADPGTDAGEPRRPTQP